MPRYEVIMGNLAASEGVRLSRAQVISAYPITPQTQIVEELSEMCADGRLKANFIKVESEHSAMASLIGAAQAGARTFTATSAQGLALMHELLFWSAYERLPIVLVDVNRAMAPGWSIWSDQTDSLAQRDTGWIQMYCESNQEILDTIPIAYKLAEKVMLPVMVVYDAFFLSHTYEPVEIPDQKDIDAFLPAYKPKIFLDTQAPRAFNPLVTPEHYMGLRNIMEKAHEDAHIELENIFKDFKKIFKREYSSIETYRMEGAETALVLSGSSASTARIVVDELREKGENVGLIKMKLFRPFPKRALINLITERHGPTLKKLAILDRNISHGVGGIWSQEIKAALYGTKTPPLIYSFLVGLGGKDITPEIIQKGYEYAKKGEKSSDKPIWL